ncbi:MAG: hypothetical protein ACWA6U_10670 [Breznakibacter sp.]
MINNIVVKILILIAALILLLIFSINLYNDYSYYSTKKDAVAKIVDIRKVEELKPYLLTVQYYNDYFDQELQCSIRLDGRFGRKMFEESPKEVSIVYTEKRGCNFYIVGYKKPNIGGFIIHLTLFVIILLGTIMIIWDIYKAPVPSAGAEL